MQRMRKKQRAPKHMYVYITRYHMMCNMHKWNTFDISDGTSNKDASCGFLLCSYGAFVCAMCLWVGES